MPEESSPPPEVTWVSWSQTATLPPQPLSAYSLGLPGPGPRGFRDKGPSGLSEMGSHSVSHSPHLGPAQD